MDVRSPLAASERPIALSCEFNQDTSCFSVGYDNGFHIYNSDPCELNTTRELKGGIGIASMLGRANFLALVGGGRNPKYPQNKVMIWDDNKKKPVISLEFHSAVRAARLSRTKIVAVLLGHVHVYAFSSPPTRIHVFETFDNTLGLVAMSKTTLAFPGRTPGHVQLCNLGTSNVSIIPAHESPLAAIEISQDGRLVATASEKGTIIRVYSTSNCSLVAEYRRGLDRAIIYSLAISPNSERLAVTSDKNTLHVFQLPPGVSGGAVKSPTHDARPSSSASSTGLAGENKKWGLLGKLPLLPKYFASEWSAAQAQFEGEGKATVGWLDEDAMAVVCLGRKGVSGGDAKWEKFVMVEGEGGLAELVREGWRGYLKPS